MATLRRRNARGAGRAVDPLDALAARAAALDSLSRRDHSSEELRDKLRGKGYDHALVNDLIERLRAENLLDDDRYLENFIAYHAARGQGPNRIRVDLRHLGLPEAQVEVSLAAYPDWTAQLKRAREKKFGTSLPTNYADRQRQARFLAYRGFSGAQIRNALGFDTDLDGDTKDEI